MERIMIALAVEGQPLVAQDQALNISNQTLNGLGIVSIATGISSIAYGIAYRALLAWPIGNTLASAGLGMLMADAPIPAAKMRKMAWVVMSSAVAGMVLTLLPEDNTTYKVAAIIGEAITSGIVAGGMAYAADR